MDISNIRPITLDRAIRTQQPSKAVSNDRSESNPSDSLRHEITGPLADRILEASGIPPAEISRYNVRLDIDDDTGRVVAEVRKKESGELVAEVPSRTLLRQAAMLREVLGTILDTPV